MRGVHPALAVLLALTALLGVGWTSATAPFSGPDEIAHFAYVQHLAETGDGPQREGGVLAQSSEIGVTLGDLGLYPIIGHAEARPDWNAVDDIERSLRRAPSSIRKDGSGPNPAGNYPPLYYAYGALAYRLSPDTSVLARVTAVRLAGVLLMLLTVLLAWKIACELFVRVWPRVVMTGLVALQPKLGFIAGVVNPDIALVIETTALLLVGLRTAKYGLTWKRALLLGLIAGAGVLTHGRGLALVPPAALAGLLGLVRFRPALRAALGSIAAGSAALVACGVAATLWTRGHANGGAYGGQANIGSAFDFREMLSYTWQFYFPRLEAMTVRGGPDYGYRQVWIDTFFGSFGSLEVNFRPRTYDAVQVAAAVGILAVYSFVLVRWRRVRSKWVEVVLLLGTLGSMLALLHVVSYNALRGGGLDPIITGRYLLPCIAIYGAAAAWVCSSLPRRLGVVVGTLLLVSSAMLAIGGLGQSMARFYG